MKSSQQLAASAARELIDGKNPAVDIGDYSNGSYDEELAAQIILRETGLEGLVECAEALRICLDWIDRNTGGTGICSHPDCDTCATINQAKLALSKLTPPEA